MEVGTGSMGETTPGVSVPSGARIAPAASTIIDFLSTAQTKQV